MIVVVLVVTSNRGPDIRMWKIGQKILESRARGPGGDQKKKETTNGPLIMN